MDVHIPWSPHFNERYVGLPTWRHFVVCDLLYSFLGLGDYKNRYGI